MRGHNMEPPSLLRLSCLALLFLIYSISPAFAGLSIRCSTCEFRAGRAMAALDFGAEGQTSLVMDVAASEAIRTSSTPLSFTIEAWVWVAQPALGRAQPLFARYPQTGIVQGNSRAEFVLQLQGNGDLNLFFGGGSANVNRLALNLDCGFNLIKPSTWTHVALTVSTLPGLVNPNAARVYINGVPECMWPGFDSANTTFAGTRQVMHNEPFVFSRYEVASSSGCSPTLQTFSGRMDSIRVWPGARSPAEIRSSYDLVLDDPESSAVGIFNLDSYDEVTNMEAGDSSRLDAPASLIGEGDARPQWVASGAVVRETVEATNFLLAPLRFYGFSSDIEDEFAIQVDIEGLNAELESIYLDPGANVRYTSPSMRISVGPENYAIAYFLTKSPVDYVATVRYRTVSYTNEVPITPVYSNWATIKVNVKVTGCDGEGALLDRCGACDGEGLCSPYGCDGEGSRLDECGVCNGDGESCTCSLANWRGFTTETLDKSIVFYDLGHLNQTISEANSVIDEVSRLLLDGEGGYDDLTCAMYTEALNKVRTLQTKASIYNQKFLSAFLGNLAPHPTPSNERR